MKKAQRILALVIALSVIGLIAVRLHNSQEEKKSKVIVKP